MALNLIKHGRPDIEKIHLHVKDPLESKYQLLINGREKVGIKKLKNPRAFLDYYSQQLMMSMNIWKIIIQQRKNKC